MVLIVAYINIILQISLLEESGSIERALDELRKKEPKIVSLNYYISYELMF